MGFDLDPILLLSDLCFIEDASLPNTHKVNPIIEVTPGKAKASGRFNAGGYLDLNSEPETRNPKVIRNNRMEDLSGCWG